MFGVCFLNMLGQPLRVLCKNPGEPQEGNSPSETSPSHLQTLGTQEYLGSYAKTILFSHLILALG